MRIITAILVVLIFITDTLQAQSFYGSRRNRSTILTVGTGTTSYFGDLNDPGDRFDAEPNVNVGLQYYFNERFGARAEVTWFQLEGTDEDVFPVRNLSFHSNNFELNVIGIFDIIPQGRRFYQRETVMPYVFLGVGLVYFNPQADYQGETYALQPLQTEGVDYSRVAFMVPFGGGVKFKVSPFFNIGLEVGYRHAFTDYMDDVSTTYVDKSHLPPDNIERILADRRPEADLPPWPEGHIRGNPEDNDGYAILNLKLEYYLPGDLFSSGYSRKPPKRRTPRRRRR